MDVKIGLETHVQLDTDTKLFCGCSTESSDQPNSQVCEVCLGMPGSKPRPNEKAVRYAVKAALALGCRINNRSFFSRKTYFYPDMSKNFQITQYEIPVGEEGTVFIESEDERKEIDVERVHIEEDPAKLVHKGGDIASADYVLADYNRSGTPLIEIVTRPDFESPSEARTFLRKLTRILRYVGVYDPSADLTIKSDANISIEGGSKVEVKNITGTKAIERALSYEMMRQKNRRRKEGDVKQETRGFDAGQGITKPLRMKESEAGYGYIFEPDLPELSSEDREESAEEEMPELPDEKLERFQEQYQISSQLAKSLVRTPEIANDFEELASRHEPQLVASWMAGELKKNLNYREISYEEPSITIDWFETLLEFIEDDKISDRNAEMLIREMLDNPRDPEKIAEEEDLLSTEELDVEGTAEEVLEENQDAVEDYREGKEEALNFLVGKIMERSGAKADPKEAREILLEKLG
ncbi:MAG: Asp-tRNA(Asn)/Glu-tRNA(Gln) amidotransferase subunit GatB [Candidatus Nanohaloarchaea archaeon]|nr:Asp-tRNA(Asn)/Glu-tRNA(Gln) amidotransferase subunit GatB [Candidatus Nanohaloarchaea archaeon]